jgi:membrane-anchored protein YejM (alkaline phosphatase superfamily)
VTEADSSVRVTRGKLIRWIGWFGIVNAGLYALIGTRYLAAYGVPETGIAMAYIACAFIAQFAVLGFIPAMLLLAPVTLILPRKGLVMTLGVLLAAFGATLFVLDTNIFSEYRYHMSRLTIEIFEPSTWVFAGIIFFVLLLFQTMLAANVWQRVASKQSGRPGIWLAAGLVMVWLTGQGMHIWGDATAYAPVTGFTRYMPLYFPIKAKRRLAKLGWVDPEQVEQQRLLRRASTPDAGQLQYPLNPLTCEPPARLPNILFVLIDALRPDHITAEFTPSISEFAAQGQNFTNHFSGGNSSRMGLFSMFYGLPSTYWQAFYDLQRPPLIMEQLQANNYEIAAFSAVGFGSPAQIDRTVFSAVPSSDRYAASTEHNRNGEITAAWTDWIGARAQPDQPHFSMLYYDPGYSPASVADDVEGELAQRHEAYRQGIAAVDGEVTRLLANPHLQQPDRDTLVIIASDHGYEFDELGLGNIGHGSNYGPWQLRSVLMFDWPGRPAKQFEYRSAHQDLPGTLLKEVFGCTNPYTDYSSGGNLFDEQPWRWIMAGSYSSHAIIEPDTILVTYPGGLIELLGPDYRPAPDLQLNPQLIEEAMVEMRRFYK